jgi:Homeodomain-like domain
LFLSRWRANWQRSLIIVQPATVLRWRRRGLWAIWLSGSCRRWRGGRPRINSEVRALIVRMSQENFLWGAPRIHGELLKLGFDVSQATVSRYMPRRGYPPTQTWRTFLRNQAFGIGTIGLGEAGRLSGKPLALVRGWIARVFRCVTKMRDGFRCGLIEPSLTLHRLRPYRSSNRTSRRDPRSGCVPVSRPPTTLGRGHNWTVACRRLSPYRSRASPTGKLPAFTNFARPTAIARAQAAHNS